MKWLAPLVSMMFLTMMAADQKPDFTGHWVLNVEKSSFGKMPKPTSMSLNARQEGGVFKAEQTVDDQQGHRTTTSEWFNDGKEHPIDIGGPGKERTYWEGNTLVNQRRSDDGHYQQTIRLSLSADGKTATEKISTKDPNGSTNGTLVWERK